MQIKTSHPVMTGSIDDLIAKLSVDLEDQAAEQRKAGRQAEETRHQSALHSIERQRDAATTQMAAGLVNAGAGALSVTIDESAGKAMQALGSLVSEALVFHKSGQDADAAKLAEKAKVMEHVRGEKDDGAQSSSRLADKAMTHLSDIQRLMHEARMKAIRG